MFWGKKKLFLCEVCRKKFPEEQIMSIRNVGPSIISMLKETSPDYSYDGNVCLNDLKKLRLKQIATYFGSDTHGFESAQRFLLEEEEEGLYDLNQKYQGQLSKGERISQKVTLFIGSWKFISLFLLFLFLWMFLNTQEIIKFHFDPFPFILLNLSLSCLAAGQAPVILMSQNRLSKRERIRADEDYYTNLKAELEIRQLHEKIDQLLKNQSKSD